MALFKMNRGNKSNLPTKKTEGYCYITVDEKKFYFDYLDASGNVQRGVLNSETATKLASAITIGSASFDGSSPITLDQMGAAAKPIKSTVTLPVSGWTNKKQTITVQGVTASNTVIVGPDPASAKDYSFAGIICTAQALNSLTMECEIAPQNPINLNILIIEA